MRLAVLALAGLATIGCVPGQEAVLVYSSVGDASINYGITADSVVVSGPGGIIELERDGTFRTTITEQPFTRMATGYGWVAWSDVVALGNSRFTTRFTRRSERGIEEATWPLEMGNVDTLLATPDGIVIRDTYQSNLWFWGASAITPLVLGETDIVPAAFDDGWLYGPVNASSALGQGKLMRFTLDGTRKEAFTAYGGPEGATSFAVSGARLAYVANGYPSARLHMVDLETRRQRELGEVPYASYAMALSDDHVFVDAYRVDDGIKRFLPAVDARILRLDVVGDSLCWSAVVYMPDGLGSELSIYCADASGEPLVSPPAGDDRRPPWL